MNRQPRRILDILKIRRIDAMISLTELMETAFWSFPTSTDDVTPYGIAYWIVKAGMSTTGGFNGTLQSGYTTVGGVNPTTYPRWRNWNCQYTVVSKDDLIRKWREAATKTDFTPPVDGIPTFNTGDQYGFYSNYAVIGALEEVLEAQNDDLGEDVASMDGRAVFRRSPVNYVPKLDADTTGPVYGHELGHFQNVHPQRLVAARGQHQHGAGSAHRRQRPRR
jgi:hypothetical protein